jgi:hypothetical protein
MIDLLFTFDPIMIGRFLAGRDRATTPAGASLIWSLTMADSASNDPFIQQFFARLPPELRTGFDDRQLAALKSVFGDATRSGHGFDIRLSLPLWRRGIYVILLGGRDRRSDDVRRSERRRGLSRLAGLVVGSLFVLQIGLAVAGLLIWLLGD